MSSLWRRRCRGWNPCPSRRSPTGSHVRWWSFSTATPRNSSKRPSGLTRKSALPARHCSTSSSRPTTSRATPSQGGGAILSERRSPWWMNAASKSLGCCWNRSLEITSATQWSQRRYKTCRKPWGRSLRQNVSDAWGTRCLFLPCSSVYLSSAPRKDESDLLLFSWFPQGANPSEPRTKHNTKLSLPNLCLH